MDANTVPIPGDERWERFLEHLRSHHSLSGLTEIGRGGMGRVYKAWDDSLARWSAVKVLDDSVTSPESLQRFRQESQILGRLRHPAIVGVHSAKTSPEGISYFTMDFVPGGDLGARIARRREEKKPYTVAEVVRQLTPIATALDTIHRMDPPVVHRDIKPANILVPEESAAWGTAILTDFGISVSPDKGRLTSEGFLIGTDHYMAPEQFRAVAGDQPMPGSSIDRYAFALIIVEMLTLRRVRDMMGQDAWRFARRIPPLPAAALALENRSCARSILAVLNRALADNPAHRYVSASGILEDLEYAAAKNDSEQGAGKVPRAVGPTAEPRSPRRPRRFLPVLSGIFILILFIGVVGGFFVVDKIRHPRWSGVDADAVAAFPALLPDRQNGDGWLGMRCESQDPEEGEQGRIFCSGAGRALVIADFGDVRTRNERGAASDMRTLTAGACSIETGSVNQTTGEAWAVLPQTEGKDRYALLLEAESAETDVLHIPVC